MAQNKAGKSLEEAVKEQELSLYRPAAHNLSIAAREYEYIEVYAFPAIDSVLAAALAVDFIISNNGRAKAIISLEPPEQPQTPLLLLGYPSQLVLEMKFRAPSVLVTNTDKPQGLTPIPIVSKRDTSITGMTVNILHEIGVVGDKALLAIIAGYWRGYDIGKKADFIGAEKEIVKTLKMEEKLLEELTIRVFRWYSEPLHRAIYLTMDPFLPGLTGQEDGINRFFGEDPRLQALRDIKAPQASEEKLVVLGEKLYRLLKEKSRIARKPSEIIGFAYHAPSFPVPDVREAAIILASLAASHGLAYLAAIASQPEPVMAVAHYYYYTRVFHQLSSSIEEYITKGEKPAVRHQMGARIAGLSLARHLIPVAERELKKLGIIPADSLTASPDGYVVIENSVKAYGYSWVYDKIREKCLEYEPGTLFAMLKAQCR